jgi:hypothetical protein
MWAYITSVAAVAAVAFSALQWMTAQTKIALEVQTARYAIYTDLRDVVTRFLQNLDFSNEQHGKFLDAQSRARFHFGAEVSDYLETIRRDMIAGQLFARYGSGQPNAKLNEEVERLDRINAFYTEIDRKFVPYMRLDQRMPLWWWTPLVAKLRSLSEKKFEVTIVGLRSYRFQ